MAGFQGTGLPRNTAAALSYVLGPVTGIIFLVLERDNYVRYHAIQSTLFSLFLWILAQFFASFRVLAFLSSLTWLVWFGLMLFLVVQAHLGVEYELPWIGKLSRRLLKTA